jgi:hypothetical protein
MPIKSHFTPYVAVVSFQKNHIWGKNQIGLNANSYCLGVLGGILPNHFQSCMCGSPLYNSPIQALFWKV